ncbi:MAG: hypothetical protein U0746_09625 [Gemmataceae bacterium]
MTTRLRLASALSTFVLMAAFVVARPEPPATAKDPLEPLAWCVGKWTADVKGADGTPLHIETTFDWAGHRKAIKFAVAFTAGGKTNVQYDGIYYWHPGKQKIAMLQVDKAGNVTESTAVAERDTVRQENAVALIGGAKGEQRVEITRKGDDAFEFRAKILKDKEWVEVVGFTYKRLPAAK